MSPSWNDILDARSVVEEESPDGWVEHPGLLKEYTSGWIEVLDCRTRGAYRFPLVSGEDPGISDNIDLSVCLIPRVQGETARLDFHVENKGYRPVQILRLENNSYCHEVNLKVPAGKSRSFSVEDLPAECWTRLPQGEQTLEFSFQAGGAESEVATQGAQLALGIDLVVDATRESLTSACLGQSVLCGTVGKRCRVIPRGCHREVDQGVGKAKPKRINGLRLRDGKIASR